MLSVEVLLLNFTETTLISDHIILVTSDNKISWFEKVSVSVMVDN